MRKSVTLHQKWTISSVNVTTSGASCGFDNIYWRFLDGKLSLMGRMITFKKARGAVRAITTLIEYLWHVICQIWFDKIYLLIDNIYTSDRHIHFYFPWWQNYGTVLKYFNMQSLATSLYPRKFRWVIYTLYKSELWKALRLRYDCTKFHVPEEEMLEEVGIKSCPLYKEAASKRPVLNKFVIF